MLESSNDYWENDLVQSCDNVVKTTQQCIESCANTPGCRAFSHFVDSTVNCDQVGACWLKSASDPKKLVIEPGMVGGIAAGTLK